MKYQDPLKIISVKHNVKYDSHYSPEYQPLEFLKYFGKKVKAIQKHSDITRALNLSKYFISFELSKDAIQPYSLKAKGSRVICLEKVEIYHKLQLKRVFMACKRKLKVEKFVSDEEFFFRLMRIHMREIRHINLQWNFENQFKFDTRALASLGHLEKLTICVQNDDGFDPNQEEELNLIQLVKNIIRLPRLKRLYLDVLNIKISADSVSDLTSLIADSQIDDWFLGINISRDYADSLNALKPVLEKINILGFAINEACLEPRKTINTQIPHEKKKILNLFLDTTQFIYDNNAPRVNLFCILKHCRLLQVLMLDSCTGYSLYQEQDFALLFKNHSGERQSLERISEFTQWAQNLRIAVLFENWNPRHEDQESFIKGVLKKIQEESRDLKILNLFDDLEIHSLTFDELLRTKPLENVRLSLQTSEYQYLKQILLSAKNLTVLKLRLSHENPEKSWDEELPFSSLKNLKELKISVTNKTEGAFWGDNLANQVLALKKLEVFSVKVGNLSKIDFEKVCLFLQNAAMLPNLKYLQLRAQIVLTAYDRLRNQRSINQELFAELDNMVKNLTHKIQDALNQMIYTHQKLEFCQIEKFKDHADLEINSSIFYDRYDSKSFKML